MYTEEVDAIKQSIKIYVEEVIKSIKLTYVIDGTIKKVIDTNTYEVDLFGNIEILNSMNGHQYTVNDVVYVIVFNNNYSDKKILCKR